MNSNWKKANVTITYFAMVGQWVSVRTLDPNLALHVDATSVK